MKRYNEIKLHLIDYENNFFVNLFKNENILRVIFKLPFDRVIHNSQDPYLQLFDLLICSPLVALFMALLECSNGNILQMTTISFL